MTRHTAVLAVILLSSCTTPEAPSIPAPCPPQIAAPAPVENPNPDPEIPFQCSDTRIATIGTRLTEGDGTPVPDSGSVIVLNNGIQLVDYVTPETVAREKPGDRVQVCLVWVPTDCPPGDDRGKTYRVYDYKQRRSYVMIDSGHMCGGA